MFCSMSLSAYSTQYLLVLTIYASALFEMVCMDFVAFKLYENAHFGIAKVSVIKGTLS